MRSSRTRSAQALSPWCIRRTKRLALISSNRRRCLSACGASRYAAGACSSPYRCLVAFGWAGQKALSPPAGSCAVPGAASGPLCPPGQQLPRLRQNVVPGPPAALPFTLPGTGTGPPQGKRKQSLMALPGLPCKKQGSKRGNRSRLWWAPRFAPPARRRVVEPRRGASSVGSAAARAVCSRPAAYPLLCGLSFPPAGGERAFSGWWCAARPRINWWC